MTTYEWIMTVMRAAAVIIIWYGVWTLYRDDRAIKRRRENQNRNLIKTD